MDFRVHEIPYGEAIVVFVLLEDLQRLRTWEARGWWRPGDRVMALRTPVPRPPPSIHSSRFLQTNDLSVFWLGLDSVKPDSLNRPRQLGTTDWAGRMRCVTQNRRTLTIPRTTG